MSIASDDLLQLLNQARMSLPGASDAGLKSQLFDVLSEFFNDSSAWSEDISIIIPGDGVTRTYNVIPNGGVIIRLAGVVDASNFPQAAIMPTPGSLLFASAYTVAATFTATVIKNVAAPTGKDCLPEVPDYVLPLWRDYIREGLLGYMMLQPAKSYSNKEGGILHFKRYRMGVSMARTAALRRNTFGTQSWSYPQGFATSTQKGSVSTGSDTRFR